MKASPFKVSTPRRGAVLALQELLARLPADKSLTVFPSIPSPVAHTGKRWGGSKLPDQRQGTEMQTCSLVRQASRGREPFFSSPPFLGRSVGCIPPRQLGL
jgi:hypothetical protein